MQYGLTVGELARLVTGQNWISSVPPLKIVPLQGWERSRWWDETDIPWYSPSPNIPDLETAILYPGLCLFEGTNVSEGRGTDHPFRWIGAPWIDGKVWAHQLLDRRLAGILFEPVVFTPVDLPGRALNPKYEGQVCQGVQLDVIDRNHFDPVKTAVVMLTVLREIYPDQFEVNASWLDKLWGSHGLSAFLRQEPGAGQPAWESTETEFRQLVRPYLLYP
ncbi:MAG: DUF1343 domain-containing protein [Candidatus Neomarinimicrobiota bacterium]|nr:MAG: DUF1343 domain-containing protein [Candidatus Neomarinimicrobiota bacterium]